MNNRDTSRYRRMLEKRYAGGIKATPVNVARLFSMPIDDAKHLRDRALDCRNLAKGARNPKDAAMLDEIAEELDAEARKIDTEAKIDPPGR